MSRQSQSHLIPKISTSIPERSTSIPKGSASLPKLLFSIFVAVSFFAGFFCEGTVAAPLGKLLSSKTKPVKNPIVIIETPKGVIKMVVFQEDMPTTSAQFLDLVSKGFYNGLTFHRFDPNFVIQGGDPTGTGSGTSGTTIPLEINHKYKHDKFGMVGMAHYPSDSNSGSCQFYITLGPQSALDEDYAIFGEVIEGQDFVYMLRPGDVMTKVYLKGKEKKAE